MTTETQAPAPGSALREAESLGILGVMLTAIYLICAAAVLGWGAWKRFQLPQYPLIDPDIVGYLGPAMTALAGKPFPHLIGRSFPYPAFVYLILRLFGDFRAISIVQHILGIAAGALILLAWNAAGALVPPGGIPRPLFRFMGLAPAYVFLGSATAIAFEHQIRPEGIFPFLAILNLWLSFRFLEARFIRPSPSFLQLGALNVFISFLMYMAKPSFGIATLLSTLPVWLSLILPGRMPRENAKLAAASILPALLLLFLPEHIMKRDDEWATLFLPQTLLSAHAALINRQMSEDLAGNGPLPFPRDLVQAAHDMLSDELAKAPQIIAQQEDALTSYKPDYLLLEYIMYGDSFCVKFPQEMHLGDQAMADFCTTYYRRAFWHHPGAMAAKIKGQLALFYTARNPVYWSGKSMDLSAIQYARVAPLMAVPGELDPGNPAVKRYIDASKRLAGEGVAISQARRFIEWLQFFSAHYLDLLGVALLSPLLLLLRPLRAHFLWLVVALWLGYSYNFGNCLTIAVVHSLEVTRYIRIQLIFTLFSQCLSLCLLLELAVFAVRSAIPGPSPAPPPPHR